MVLKKILVAMGTIFIRQLLRIFRKDRVHKILNMLGLSLGLTASILVLLYVQQVLGFDKFHANRGRIYRYGVTMTIGSSPTSTQQGCYPGTGPILKQAIPGIEDYVRTLYMGNSRVIIGEKVFNESRFGLMWADQSIFRVFSFPLLAGDEGSALARPNTMVITRDLAMKYFGSLDVIGKTVEIENNGNFEITGLLDDIPANSGLLFSGLLSMVTINSNDPGDYLINRFSYDMGSFLFLLFARDYTGEDFNADFIAWYDQYLAESDQINYVAVVEPYEDFYLHSTIWSSFSQRNRMVLTGFVSIGLLLLLLASVNYINLTTSRSGERAREICIKKISGAHPASLRWQLMGESIVFTYFSMFLALVLAEFLLSFTMLGDLIASVNAFVGVRISLHPFQNPLLLAGILLLPVVIGLLAGLYPAFLMSAMKPVTVLRTSQPGGSGKSFLRKFLLIFQFTISIGALILSLLMTRQIHRISHIDPGFSEENLVYIFCTDQSVKSNFQAYERKIAANPAVVSTSFSDRSPGLNHSGWAWNWETESGKMEIYPAVLVQADMHYLQTLGLELVAGRNFVKPRLENDTIINCIVNETFVRAMGWENPVGKRNDRGEVIGVVKDYHYNSMTDPLRPLFIIQYREDRIPNMLNVKISGEDRGSTLAFLEQSWEDLVPEVPFDYSFASDLMEELYASNKTQGLITNWLGMTCLLISVFGMLSYSSYIAFRKRKEFVIRKVMGATGSRIFLEFAAIIMKIMLIPVILANLLAWYAFREWSKDFVSNPPVQWWVFALATLAMFLLALLTAAYHVIHTARLNPVDNLAYE